MVLRAVPHGFQDTEQPPVYRSLKLELVQLVERPDKSSFDKVIGHNWAAGEYKRKATKAG